MVRGGSWNNNDNNVRCAVRNRNNSNNRNDNIGFRVMSHGFTPALMAAPSRVGAFTSIPARLRLRRRGAEAGAAVSWPSLGSAMSRPGPGIYQAGLRPDRSRLPAGLAQTQAVGRNRGV
ncbi:MAG: hypothetical protein KJZ93_24485 [Caldilineaceae bacterium]|nr:hypothetical protein [Caldilineaceae bacterium]